MLRLAKGDSATLRLSNRWRWSEPRVSTNAVELTPVEYFVDPGFREWTIDARTSGRATIRSVGKPALLDLRAPDAPFRGDGRRLPLELRHAATVAAMCRNIKTLYNFEPPTTQEEIREAALQYVRKVSGMSKPSQANEAAFEHAVHEIATVTATLLERLVTSAAPRDREVEAERRRARAAERFGRAA